MHRSAIITGISGQDASYLAELLLSKDYKVYGLKRRTSLNDLGCSRHLEGLIEVVEGDLNDTASLTRLCRLASADEFYNLAGQSHVGTSFHQPAYTLKATGEGALNCLEAIRQSGIHTRFYQASTSEMFGGAPVAGETAPMSLETNVFDPKSPYAAAKMYAHNITCIYRESYKMFACCGVLFNHESERRGPNFVTRKIAIAVARIKYKLQEKVSLGFIDAKRDWGHAKDFVYGMYLMLQNRHPEDFVLATGETHSVREFCKVAFDHAGLGDYEQYVHIDPNLYRPSEVPALRGDYSRAQKVLGWEPTINFEELVKMMVDSELERASHGSE